MTDATASRRGSSTALADAAGADVDARAPERPRARRLRDERRAPGSPASGGARRASSRRSSPRGAAELPAVERAEVAGPGLRQPLASTDAWYGEALAELLGAGERYGAGSAATPRAGPGRDGVGEPDRPDHRRGGAERRLRRLRRAAARVRGPRGRARVLLQRRGRPDGALPRVGRGAPARRGAARGRVPRRVHRGARAGGRRPGAARCSRGSRRRSSASASTSTRWAKQSELERRLPELLPRLDTYEKDGAVWARSTAYGDEKDRVLDPLRDGRADLPRRRRRLPRRQARAGLRPRDLRARRRPPRHVATGTRPSRGCSATTPSASRCCSTSSST